MFLWDITSQSAENLTSLFLLVQALQSSTQYLNLKSSFQCPAIFMLKSHGKERHENLVKMGCKSVLHIGVKFILGFVNLHRASIYPTMGSAVFPAHLLLPTNVSTLLFLNSLHVLRMSNFK